MRSERRHYLELRDEDWEGLAKRLEATLRDERTRVRRRPVNVDGPAEEYARPGEYDPVLRSHCRLVEGREE